MIGLAAEKNIITPDDVIWESCCPSQLLLILVQYVWLHFIYYPDTCLFVPVELLPSTFYIPYGAAFILLVPLFKAQFSISVIIFSQKLFT